MKLFDVNNWKRKLKSGAGGLILGVSLLLGTSTVTEAANNVNIENKGCSAKPTNDYHTVLISNPHPGHDDYTIYICNDDSYIKSNLDKVIGGKKYKWAELDMVPHRIFIDNGTDENQSFSYNVGGDYRDNSANDIGWDYITELSLDVGLSDPACKNVEKLVAQGIAYQDGHGHDVPQETAAKIYRTIEVVNLPPNTHCVANYNMRLALGSSAYSGNSMHSEFVPGDENIQTGSKDIPLSIDEAYGIDKDTSAVQDGAISWAINKSATPATINFDDTCTDDPDALVRDVNVTITWTKSNPTPAGQVTVTTIIRAPVVGHRPVNVTVVDTLYSGTTQLGAPHTCTAELQPNILNQEICTYSVTIDENDAVNLNDKAVATYSDPLSSEPIRLSMEATDTTEVLPSGSNTDNTAVVTDHQWIHNADNTTYSVLSRTGTQGTFLNYTLGSKTSGDINWTSGTINADGSTTFIQKVYATQGDIVSDGHLHDIASLEGSDGFSVSSELNPPVIINASATVSLTINKEVTQDIVDENKALTFEFNVYKEGNLVGTYPVVIAAGEASASKTISGLQMGTYRVEEIPKTGYANEGSSSRVITMDTPCETYEADFRNKFAGRPAVIASKTTFPAMIGAEDQGAGWTLTLQKEITAGNWEDVNSSTTSGSGTSMTLKEEGHLTEGHYRIIESSKEGWYKVTEIGCDFNYPDDLTNEDGTRDDYICSFANAKLAKIIIKKEIDSVQQYTQKFNFEQDIESGSALLLGNDQNETYDSLHAMSVGATSSTFHVSEDPGTHFALQNIVCDEYYAPGIPAIENSTVDTDQHREATIILDPGETVECTFTNSVVEHPALTIEKSTNRDDADNAPGPEVLVGDPVNWEYKIQNTGDVPLHDVVVTDNQGVTIDCNGKTTLDIGEVMTCTASGVAVEGQYANTGTVTAKTPENATTSANDSSHYFGKEKPVEHPAIHIEKSTNGHDADASADAPTITVGSAVHWSYVVHNYGDVALSNVTVTDDQGVAVSCPKTTLAKDETMTCIADGIAVEGLYTNTGTATAKTPENATVTDSDTSHYIGEVIIEESPSISIEKHTNGEDADTPTGPHITVGDPVNWEYIVKNTGNVALDTINIIDNRNVRVSCPKSTLGVGESMTCTASGTAVAGQYSNTGTVTAKSPERTTVSDEDPSHYFGEEEPVVEHPSIDIEKLTNDKDNPTIPAGETITWTYTVTNTGDVTLSNISVTDDKEGEITCPKTALTVNESMTCTATGVAVEGPYTNVGTVTSESPEGHTTTDEDTGHYTGQALPSMEINKLTNGEDADVAPGPKITIGESVTWTYIVHNTGNVPLRNVTVGDDQEGEVQCPQTTLDVDETMECTLSGTATVGQYENIATATALASEDTEITATDTSHYLGTDEATGPEEGERCPCNDVKSDSSDAMSLTTAIGMILMTLFAALFFLSREEQLNTIEK